MFKFILNLMLIVFALELCESNILEKDAVKNDNSVCYEYVGCFSGEYPFNNTILPESPDAIGTNFLLFTPQNKIDSDLLSYKDTSSIRSSKFNRNLPLKIIVHGFAGQQPNENDFQHKFKNAILEVENANVLIVNWQAGSEAPHYSNASANLRVVGAELNLILKDIKSIFNPNQLSIHCIGHSLGAHLCGYAGHLSEIRFDRISALDPAGPFFEDSPKEARIDKADANFVDAVHTNGGIIVSLSFGLKIAIGHVDFYVNGGEQQPGCPTFSQIAISCITDFNGCFNNPSEKVSCNHNRVLDLYLESIKSSCSFKSMRCANKEKYDNGECDSCIGQACGVMGYYAGSFDQSGSHYLTTSSQAPFCGEQYLFEMTMNKDSAKSAGEIVLNIEAKESFSVFPQNTELKPDSTIKNYFVSDKKYDGNLDVELTFNKKPKPFFGKETNSKNISVDKFKLVNLNSKQIMSKCEKGLYWEDKQVVKRKLFTLDCNVQ